MQTSRKRFGVILLCATFCLADSFGGIDEAGLRERAAAVLTAYPSQRAPVGVPSYGAGTPWDDLILIAPTQTQQGGETAGYDTWMPTSGKAPFPGADWVSLFECSMTPNVDTKQGAARGDRIILGTPEAGVFFQRGDGVNGDGVDNDYLRIQAFDYNFGHIQLTGSVPDYALVHCATTDGVPWPGYALFYLSASGTIPDLIAYVDDALTQYAGAPANGVLALTNPAQFRYVNTQPGPPTHPGLGFAQIGTDGKETVNGIVVDHRGRIYVTGFSEGDIRQRGRRGNEIWAACYAPNGQRLWINSLDASNGDSPFDLATDGQDVYVAGRTFPGINAGAWNGFIYKFRCSDGAVSGTATYATSELDGFGNICLTEDGLFVSGQGTGSGSTGSGDYLVASYTRDLALRWARAYVPDDTTPQVAEAWGGLAATWDGQRVYAGGWYVPRETIVDSSNGFLAALDGATGDLVWSGTSIASRHRTIGTTNRLDWVYGCAIDLHENLYACGFTTSDLAPGTQHAGEGDLFLRKYDSFGNPLWTKQWGTPRSESLRRMLTDANGNTYATCYTYGDLAATNADPQKRTADLYIAKLGPAGAPLDHTQLGSPGEERGFAALRDGTLYIAGASDGAFTGEHRGAFDGFLIRLDAESLDPVGIRLADWTRYHSLPSGPLDDPDRDNAPNLQEFVFDTDPNRPGAVPCIALEFSPETPSDLRVRYQRIRALTGVRCDIETSESLRAGSWTRHTGLPETILPGNEATGTDTVEITLPSAGSCRYVRLFIEAIP